jgi:hypothetical protein
MEYMSAEEAAEAAKGLTFEKVWAALMETRQRMEERDRKFAEEKKESDRKYAEEKKEADRKYAEEKKESDQAFMKRMEESHRRMDESNEKGMAELRSELNKSVGGLGNSLGHFIEEMFTPELSAKFNEFGFTFTTQANYKKYYKNKKRIAEVDSVLENGDHVMLVEVKTNLSDKDVDGHLTRISKIRQYMDESGDARKLVGAVAGGIVTEKTLLYAHDNGLFVITQNGEAASIAETPANFQAKEW